MPLTDTHTLSTVGFTGIDQPYERPESPELVLKTVGRSIQDTVREVIQLLENEGIVPISVNDRVRELFVAPERLAEAKTEAEGLPSVAISKVDLEWVQVLAEGWATPLKGMTQLHVLHHGLTRLQFLSRIHERARISPKPALQLPVG